jgi:hypothetical protein
MGRTACTEPQCLYKGALYLYLTLYFTGQTMELADLGFEILHLLNRRNCIVCVTCSTNLMFVDPYIIVQFIKKNPTKCNMYKNFIITYNVHQLHVQQPSTYEKPEAASAILRS